MPATDRDAELLAASRRELALYRELVAVYGDLAQALDDETLDAARLAHGNERAELLIAELRALRGALAPARLAGDAVCVEIRAVWRASAELAADAASRNAELTARSRARQAEISARLHTLGSGRRALGAYRPLRDRTAARAAL